MFRFNISILVMMMYTIPGCICEVPFFKTWIPRTDINELVLINSEIQKPKFLIHLAETHNIRNS